MIPLSIKGTLCKPTDTSKVSGGVCPITPLRKATTTFVYMLSHSHMHVFEYQPEGSAERSLFNESKGIMLSSI